MNRSNAAIVLIGLGFLAGMIPQAMADEWDQKTTFTFSGPVEIPGQVLPAGTYVFKLADSSSDRNIVQVYNKDETHLYGTFLAVADQRLQPSDRAIITFEERAGSSPEGRQGVVLSGRGLRSRIRVSQAEGGCVSESQ